MNPAQEGSMGYLYVIRHGETAWNRAGIIQGRRETQLTEYGRQQVTHLARRLAGMEIHRGYSSPLQRTRSTAEILWNRLAAHSGDLLYIAELQEMDFGELTGHQKETVRRFYPQWYRQWQWDPDMHTPGGESFRDLVARSKRFLQEHIRQLHTTERVLIVSHGGLIRALLVVLLDLPASAAYRFEVNSASLSIFEKRGERFLLRQWNASSHLA